MKKTVAHIIDSLERGGAETLLVGVVTSLSSYNHIIIHFEPVNRFKDELPEHISVICLGAKSIKEKLLKIFVIRKILIQQGVSIVHAHLYWPTIISRFAITKGMKQITTYHNVFYNKLGAGYSPLYKFLDKITYKSRYITLCVSNQVKKDLVENLGIKQNLYTLYNYVEDKFYVNPKNIYQIGTNPLKMLSVGNLKPQKNFLEMLKIFQPLKDQNLEWHIYGEGPDRKHIENLLRRLKIKNVILQGATKNVNKIIRNYDLFFMPSRWEGFGIALLEAMASGLPCLISDLKVFQEVAGTNVMYFAISNPESAVKIIQDILQGHININNFNRMSINQAQKYRKADYLKKLAEFYS